MPRPAPPRPHQRFSSTQAYRPLRAPETVEDQDACGIYAAVNKGARPSHEAIQTRSWRSRRCSTARATWTARATAAAC